MIPALIVVPAALLIGLFAGPPPIDPEMLAAAGKAIPMQTVVFTLAPLLGSYLLVRFSLRMAGYRR